MKSFLTLLLALVAINTDLYAAEVGMPQLDPTYWSSQAFWLVLIFAILTCIYLNDALNLHH